MTGPTGARDLRRYLISQSASVFGSTMTTTAVSVLAVAVLHLSAQSVSLVVAAGLVPALLLGPFAGVALDRARRPRRVLIAADLLAAATVGWCLLRAVGGWLGELDLISLAAVLGLITVVVEALYFSHLRTFVDTDLGTARGRLQTSELASTSVGAALAGPIAAVFSPALLFTADLVTYLFSAWCLLGLRSPDTRELPQSESLGFIGEFKAGVRMLHGHPLLRAVTMFAVIASAATSAIGALRAVFLLDTLGLPVALFSLPSVAALLLATAGSVLAPRLSARFGPTALLRVAMPAGAAASCLLPLATGPLLLRLIVVTLAAALPAMLGAIANLALVTVVSESLGDEYFARVTTLIGSSTTAAGLLGVLGAGVATHVLDVRSVLAIAAAFNVLAAVVLVLASRAPAEQPATPRLVPA